MHYARNSVRYSCNIAAARAITDKPHCRCFPLRPAWQAALIIVVLVLLMPGPVFPAAPETAAVPDVLSLENAVAVAIEGNPGLAEMQARAEAMAAIP